MKTLILAIILTSGQIDHPVKKSGTGNCYDINYSLKYDKVKTYIPYKTMNDCIDSGGRKAIPTYA